MNYVKCLLVEKWILYGTISRISGKIRLHSSVKRCETIINNNLLLIPIEVTNKCSSFDQSTVGSAPIHDGGLSRNYYRSRNRVCHKIL